MSQTLITLSQDPVLDQQYKGILSDIRTAYGNTTQILVSNEELCELAAVCAKFPRYTDPGKARSELHSAAIDEVADVMIILDHVINIFDLDEQEVQSRIAGKVGRIVRWLSASSSQEQTVMDRAVEEGVNPQVRFERRPADEGSCVGCAHVGEFQQLQIGGRCFYCARSNFSQFEPKSRGGYSVRHQADHKPGSKVSKEDFVLLLTRATKRGRSFPEEVAIRILATHQGHTFPIEKYGETWEAVWLG